MGHVRHVVLGQRPSLASPRPAATDPGSLAVLATERPVTHRGRPLVDARSPDARTEAADWDRPEGSWASSEATRRSMQGNRSRDTWPELTIRRTVHGMGLRYRVATRPVSGIRVTADLVFAGSRVAVFIDGCFWHGCPAHSSTPRTNAVYWTAKIAANRARDTRASLLLSAAGWTVVRVWEHEDPRRGARRIRDVVRAASRRTAGVREPGGEVDGLGAQLHPRSRSLQRACPGVETGSP